MGLSDDMLIDKILAGDSASLELLLERHMQGIFSICFRVCGDEDDAYDCTQNACMRIMKHLKEFKRASAFKTWAYRIAYNEVLQLLRSRKEYVDLDILEPYL